MKYSIRALQEVDHDLVAQGMVELGVSDDLDKAKGTIRSWMYKRGHVSAAGERVIRHVAGDDGSSYKLEDFFDQSVLDKHLETIRESLKRRGKVAA